MIERFRCACGTSRAVGQTQTLCRACGGPMDVPIVRHGRDCPSRCSQCAGVQPRCVSPDATLVDGQPSGRQSDPTATARSYYARRGGLAKGRRTHR